MAKIKSSAELEDFIASELSRRRFEIAHLKSLLREKRESKESIVLAKSLILIAYSHWEGFVKATAQKYLDYILFLGLDISDMSPELTSAIVFDILCKTKSSTTEKINHIYTILTDDRHKHHIDSGSLVDAKSNLNSDVFKLIVRNIGLSSNEFEVNYPFLDSVILKNRNDFAHGDNRQVDIDTAIMIADKVLELMEKHKTMIENAIALKSFRKSR